MKFGKSNTLGCLLILVVASWMNVDAAKKVNRDSAFSQKQSKYIFEIFTKLSKGLCGEKDYSRGVKLLSKSTGMERSWLMATLAEYHRRMRHEPVDGIKLLTTEVLSPQDAKLWLAELKAADLVRKKKYIDAKREAKKDKKEEPPTPSGLALNFPIRKITFSADKVPVILELAQCLNKLGRIQDGLHCINTCGIHASKSKDNFLLIQSHESIGDVNKLLAEYEKAIKAYNVALKLFKQAKKEAERYSEKTNFNKWEVAVKARINRKLKEVKRLFDIERYGPEFVAYRDAHRMELQSKDYLQAVLLYNKLIEKYPETVFSEAGNAYALRCYLELGKQKAPRRGENETLVKLGKQLKKAEDFIKLAKRSKVPKAELERLSNELIPLVTKIKEIKNLPFGKDALIKAEGIAKVALQTKRFALYRAEMLCLLGDHFLEHELDQEKSFKYYADAWKWLKEIKAHNDAMAKMQVPGKATDVSKAPATEKKATGWTGWVVKNTISPGQIVNRFTTSWYLDSLRARSGKMLSLCFFIREELPKAINAARAVIIYESIEKKLYKENRPNSYQRLLRAYKLGWFRCLPAELKIFRGKLRTAVILGDFYYEVEDYAKCEYIRKNLAALKYGKLSKEQMASALYRVAEVYFIQDKNKETLKILELVATKYRSCFSAADALIGLGNIYSAKIDEKSNLKALELYHAAAKVAKDPLREKALFYEAITLLQLREPGKAKKVFASLQAKYPDGRFGKLTKKYVKKINVAEKEVK